MEPKHMGMMFRSLCAGLLLSLAGLPVWAQQTIPPGVVIPLLVPHTLADANAVNTALTAAALKGTSDAITALGDGTRSVRLSAATATLGIEIGPSTVTNFNPYIDFHTDLTGTDYNARLSAFSNLGSPGGINGTDLKVQAKRFSVAGVLRAGRQTAGQGDNGAVTSFIANSASPDLGGQAGVLGYTPGAQAVSYGDIDSVTSYIENTGRAPFFTVTSPTFSIVTGHPRLLLATPLSSTQIAQLFVGLQLLTNQTPRYTGWLSSWDAAGAWVEVTDGFFPLAGSNAIGQNPTAVPVTGGGPLQVAFAPLTKVWAQNSNCFLGGAATTGAFQVKKCAAYELGMLNNLGVDHLYSGQTTNDPNGYSWGFDAVSLGSNRAGSAHIARGNWDAGFHAEITGRYSFLVDSATTQNGFTTFQSTGTPFTVQPGGPSQSATYVITTQGAVEAGSLTAASTSFYDMHSSGFANDYDTRWSSTGGVNGQAGAGNAAIQAATLTVPNTVYAATYNTLSFGNAMFGTALTVGNGAVVSANQLWVFGGGAGSNLVNVALTGADANIGFNLYAKGTPASIFTLQDGNYITTLAVRSIAAAANSFILQAQTASQSPQITASPGANLLLGAAGNQANTITNGLPQVPYMAGVPTGTPATQGGASLVFDTTNGRLSLYNPITAAWQYEITNTTLAAYAPLASPSFNGSTRNGVSGVLSVPTGANSWNFPGGWLGWNYTGGVGETDFINSRGGGTGGFNFYNADSVASSTPGKLFGIDNVGNGTLSGGLTATNVTLSGNANAVAGFSAGSNASAGAIILNGPAASTRSFTVQTTGNSRWKFTVNNTAESGSNAGSDLLLNAYNDGGSLTTTAMQVTRATGAVLFSNAVTASSGITLANATANLINYGATGIGAPTFTTRSNGAKAVYYAALTGAATDYATGMEAGYLWQGVPIAANTNGFKWYGGVTLVASLDGTGIMSVIGGVDDTSVQYAAPATGATITLARATGKALVLNPAATIATLTVALPTAPTANQVYTISTTQTITALTISSTPNVYGNVSTLAAGSAVSFRYSSTGNFWVRT